MRARVALVVCIALAAVGATAPASALAAPQVSISGEDFLLDGTPTYPGTEVQGLLLNSRMVNALFDDENAATRSQWEYPDTGTWDPERNVNEFIAAMPSYAAKGLGAVTVNLQGGNPVPGCSCDAAHNWITTAYRSDGSLKPVWVTRMDRLLDAAAANRIVVILGLFYHGQDQRLASETAVKAAADNVVDWLLANGHDHVMIEIAGEANHSLTSHSIVRSRVHELIARVQQRSGGRLEASTGFTGGHVPSETVVGQSDFVILHGNGQTAASIRAMVDTVRSRSSWRAEPKPILFNEDSTSVTNLDAAVAKGASWGYHDKGNNNYSTGYQTPPVNWGINTSTKRAFFDRVAHYASTSTAPAISFSPASLAVSADEGGPVATRTVSLQTNNGGTPQYSVASDAAWLEVSPAGGTAPASLTVSADPAGLPPGTYTGALTASATGYGTARLNVTMTVKGPSVYGLLVSTRADRAGAVPLEGQVVSGDIRVFTGPDDGVDEVTFYIDDPNRTRSPYQREGNGPYDLAGGSVTTANGYDTEQLADGPHTVTAALRLLDGTTEVVHAAFTVRNHAPPPPSLAFTPSSLTLTATEGDPAIARDVTLAASDATAASFTASASAAWLSAQPASGATPATLSVVADPAGLAPGTYSGTLTATATGYTTATLTVSLTVAAKEPPPGEEPPSDYALMMSTRSDRGGAVPLNGRTVSGSIYVFTAPDNGVSRVTFYIDDPNRTRSPYRVENNGPFDLGGGDVTIAKPYKTTSLSDGQHTVTAVLDLAAGGSEVVHATFVVNN